MKLNELMIELRLIVREEIKAALLEREIITERQNLARGSAPRTAPEPMTRTPQPANTKKPAPKHQYSTNPLLNSILNETKPFSQSGTSLHEMIEDQYEEWPTMTQRMIPGANKKISVIPTTDLDGRPVNVNEIDESVANALTKDYSALMKAINKKKGV